MGQKQFVFTLSVGVLSGFLGGVLGVWFLIPQSVLAQEGVPEVIEAREFRVVGDGITRISLDMANNVPGVRLYDQSQRLLMILSAARAEPEIQFYDTRGLVRLGIGVLEDTPMLAMSNEKGIGRVSLGIEREGDEPKLLFLDSNGRIISVLGVLEDEPAFSFFNQEQVPRMGLIGSSLFFFDEEGNVVWSAP